MWSECKPLWTLKVEWKGLKVDKRIAKEKFRPVKNKKLRNFNFDPSKWRKNKKNKKTFARKRRT